MNTPSQIRPVNVTSFNSITLVTELGTSFDEKHPYRRSGLRSHDAMARRLQPGTAQLQRANLALRCNKVKYALCMVWTPVFAKPHQPTTPLLRLTRLACRAWTVWQADGRMGQ